MDDPKTQLNRAILRMLSPIAKLMLFFEVSHSEFVEMAKRAYVGAAYRYFTIPNRKQTHSRVSVLTGIPRKEVVRIMETRWDDGLATKGPLNRATQVLSGWLRDSRYLDQNGEPLILPLRGEAPSFETLVEDFSGDVTARAILDELIRVGSVEKVDKTSVRLLTKGFVPRTSSPDKFEMLTQHIADLTQTGFHNVQHPPQESKFQRQVVFNEIPESVKDEFRQYSYEKSLALLIDFDRWLAEKKKTTPAQTGESLHRVGVGIYFFDNKKDEENDHGDNKTT